MKRVFFSSVLLLPSALANAADKGFCSDYVLVAISQYWQSVDQNCNFSGSRWSANYKGQFDWCLSAHQWVAENEIEARARLLEECESGGSSSLSTSELPSKPTPKETLKTKQNNVEEALKRKATNNINEQLLYAVVDNDLSTVKTLVSKGADIHFVTKDEQLISKLGMRVVSRSVEGNAFTVGSASDNSAGKSVKNTQGLSVESESLLSYATVKGFSDIALWLLEKDQKNMDKAQADTIKSDVLGRALIRAVQNKDDQQIEALLEQGASINYELGQNFGTPLYFAVTAGEVALVKRLLGKGANPKYTTNAGMNMLTLALASPKILTLLLEYGADPNSNGESPTQKDYPIYAAVKQGNVKAVALLMAHGADVNIQGYEINYPLLQAIEAQQVDVVKVLLKYGANANVIYNDESAGLCSKSSENKVPLSEAMKLGNKEIVILLKSKGAKTVDEICK